jgi:hypothetical protein
MPPLDELQLLAGQIDSARDLASLRPLFDRIEEIARNHPADFEVQVAAEDLRQNIIAKGVKLRRSHERMIGYAAPVPPQAPASPPAPRTPQPVAAFQNLLRADWLADHNLRRAVWIGVAVGVVGWLVLFITLVQIARHRNMPEKASVVASSAKTVPVEFVTSPPGATIQINNETKCKSNCRVDLPPGNYQVTAMLDGFDPAATGVTVVPGPSITVNLTLPSQTQTVRVFTDLPAGKVYLDGEAAGELQDGQLVLDRVRNGKHRITVAGENANASFSFELAPGRPPAIEGAIAANNLMAVLVSSFGGDARIQSNASTPLKVALNGMPQGETSQTPLELKGVPAGDQQLTIGEGADARRMVVQFGPTPALTAFLKSDVNTGTLVVSTGENDVTVFLNGNEYRRKTRRGELRIPALGPVAVRVAKEGFQSEPEQRVEVKRGEEVRVAFKLRPMPQFASLQIHNAVPGTQVFLDDHGLGRVGEDGSLSAANLQPGEHVIEVRREGYVPRRMPRRLVAGQTLILTGAELAMPPAAGTIQLVLNPPDAQVMYRRTEETEMHSAQANPLRLEPGNYVFTARAPGHTDRTERVPVVAGETRTVQIALAKKETPPPAPKPAAATTTDWTRDGWTSEDGQFVRRGGNRVTVRSGRLDGTITFTAELRKAGWLFRGGRLRWFIQDGGGYSQFELDKKHFYTEGRKLPHPETDERIFTVQIDISPERILQRMLVGGKWVTLASLPGREIENGRFGFVIPAADEIGISNFRFIPRQD